MALEIRELVVKVTVTEGGRPPAATEDPKLMEDLKRALIRECVAEVLRQLEKLNER
ncbi:MAG TPA: DUF5908 family protein [Dinghuibacter sp.]|jgi:hypothetical protein|uniref:DUF5908 family protein n=1 Tax=Dinghuibacter sp. TaxID=2024697 RepID=UPI002C843211|nr:DUF5908 family protein [Dinghuibacter sp.]HTJ14036.1 DUF5908 family protein [Dinghuibacter sp.]